MIHLVKNLPEEGNHAANPMFEEMLLPIHWPQSTPVTSNDNNLRKIIADDKISKSKIYRVFR